MTWNSNDEDLNRHKVVLFGFRGIYELQDRNGYQKVFRCIHTVKNKFLDIDILLIFCNCPYRAMIFAGLIRWPNRWADFKSHIA